MLEKFLLFGYNCLPARQTHFLCGSQFRYSFLPASTCSRAQLLSNWDHIFQHTTSDDLVTGSSYVPWIDKVWPGMSFKYIAYVVKCIKAGETCFHVARCRGIIWREFRVALLRSALIGR